MTKGESTSIAKQEQICEWNAFWLLAFDLDQ